MSDKYKLAYSEKESKRFNLNIYRGFLENIDAAQLKNEIETNGIDVLIFRIRSINVDQIYQLHDLKYPFIQADTLIIYQIALSSYEVKPLRNNDLSFEIANTADLNVLNNLVEIIFPNYSNHYNSNPILNKTEILNGYKEWVCSFVNSASKKVFIVKKDKKAVGFASIEIENGVGEGVLYGVIPEETGKGIYSDIIRFTQNHFKSLGIFQMKVSTQIQNYSVQKVWTREGFLIKEAFATVHVNSMLSDKI